MTKESHCRSVLQHMKKYGSINHFEAEDMYGCVRLAARIKELRNRGVSIETKMTEGRNRNGETVRYAVYRLGVGE